MNMQKQQTSIQPTGGTAEEFIFWYGVSILGDIHNNYWIGLSDALHEGVWM